MTKMAYYKELNEKVAILEAVLRKKLNAPMAMVADASSEQNEEDILLAIEQNEEHILDTINYLMFSDDRIVGDKGWDCLIGISECHSDALATKAFDNAVTKACFDWLSKYMDNLPNGLADFNMERYGSIYPFTNESNCDLVTDAFAKWIGHDICDLYDANCKALQTVLDMGVKCVL